MTPVGTSRFAGTVATMSRTTHVMPDDHIVKEAALLIARTLNTEPDRTGGVLAVLESSTDPVMRDLGRELRAGTAVTDPVIMLPAAHALARTGVPGIQATLWLGAKLSRHMAPLRDNRDAAARLDELTERLTEQTGQPTLDPHLVAIIDAGLKFTDDFIPVRILTRNPDLARLCAAAGLPAQVYPDRAITLAASTVRSSRGEHHRRPGAPGR